MGPPQTPRLRSWYCFLTQFRLTIKHIPGLKNEFCDWLSRAQFETKSGENFDEIAKEAFDKMDLALDFAILYKITDTFDFEKFGLPPK